MKLGLFLVPLVAEVASLRALAERADHERIDSIWLPEPHLVAFDEYGSEFAYSPDKKMPESYTAEGELDGMLALAYLAAATTRIRIGIGVCIVPQRNPLYTAKEVTTLDHLTHGRFDFGVGIGWLEEEFRAVGASFGDRAQRCAEHIELMLALWSEDSSRAGEISPALAGGRQEPLPFQRPHPPIHFGGNGLRALERVAAWGQGWLPWDLSPTDASTGVARMVELLEARHRKREDIEVSVATTLPLREVDVHAYAEAGVDQVLVVVPPPRSDGDVVQLFAGLEAARDPREENGRGGAA